MTVGATEPVTGLLGTTSTSSTTASTGSSTSTGGLADKDTFLQLLVAQLKYQDPSNPTDSSQFLSQSAQFTALEKMQDVADKTSQLLSAQLSFGASGLVGRSVAYQLADGTTGSGLVASATFGTSGPVLQVGGVDVPIAQVLSVSAAPASPSTSTSTTSDTSTPTTSQA